jgi:hypothetical protein
MIAAIPSVPAASTVPAIDFVKRLVNIVGSFSDRVGAG